MSETEVPEQDAAPPEPAQDRFEQYPADHPLVKRLESMKAELKEAKAELKETKPKAKRLTELEEATKSEAERAADRIATESARAEAAEAALLRYQVAAEVGVPLNAVKFLTGITREEVEASAKDVLELIGESGKPRPPKPDPNQGRTSPEVTTPASQFASFLQKQLHGA